MTTVCSTSGAAAAVEPKVPVDSARDLGAVMAAVRLGGAGSATATFTGAAGMGGGGAN